MWRCLCSTTLTLLCRVQKWKHRSPNSRVNTQDTKFCVYINVFVLYFYRILCLLFHFDSKKFDWNSPSPSFESRDSRFVDSILLIVVGNPLQFHRIWDLWTLCPRRFFFINEGCTKLSSPWKNLRGKRSRDKNTAEAHLRASFQGNAKPRYDLETRLVSGKDRREDRGSEKAASLSKDLLEMVG